MERSEEIQIPNQVAQNWFSYFCYWPVATDDSSGLFWQLPESSPLWNAEIAHDFGADKSLDPDSWTWLKVFHQQTKRRKVQINEALAKPPLLSDFGVDCPAWGERARATGHGPNASPSRPRPAFWQHRDTQSGRSRAKPKPILFVLQILSSCPRSGARPGTPPPHAERMAKEEAPPADLLSSDGDDKFWSHPGSNSRVTSASPCATLGAWTDVSPA